MNIYRRNFKRLLRCDARYFTPQWRPYLEQPELLFQQPEIRYFKEDPTDTSTVALVTVENVRWVVKRYNVKNFWHRLKLWFRPSRAMTSWNNAHLLQQCDIPTLTPVAVIENRWGIFRGTAYFIYEYIEGTMCCDYFEHHADLTPIFKTALRSVADSFKKMRQHRLYHRDCHHNNMIMVGEEVLLLDLDHLKQYWFNSLFFRKAHQKDIAKFIQYLGDHQAAKEFFNKCLDQN